MMPNQDLKKFAKAFAVTLLVFVVADIVVGKMLEHLFKNQKSGILQAVSYTIDSTTAQVLVFGSSRANHHYDPSVFEKGGKSFYNCGKDGAGIVYSAAVMNAVLNRYNPELVIIDVRPDDFTDSKDRGVHDLLPFRHNENIAPYLDYISPYERIKCISSIYPYNCMLPTLITGMKARTRPGYEGYLELKSTIKDPVLKKVDIASAVNDDKVKVFDDVLKMLNTRKVPCIVVVSPYYAQAEFKTTMDRCMRICGKNNIRFYSYLNSYFNSHSQWFNDQAHLNAQGAKVFSGDLFEKIFQDGSSIKNGNSVFSNTQLIEKAAGNKQTTMERKGRG